MCNNVQLFFIFLFIFLFFHCDFLDFLHKTLHTLHTLHKLTLSLEPCGFDPYTKRYTKRYTLTQITKIEAKNEQIFHKKRGGGLFENCE